MLTVKQKQNGQSPVDPIFTDNNSTMNDKESNGNARNMDMNDNGKLRQRYFESTLITSQQDGHVKSSFNGSSYVNSSTKTANNGAKKQQLYMKKAEQNGNSKAKFQMPALHHDELMSEFGLDFQDEDPSVAWMKIGQMYQNGPDQILPTKAISTWNAKGATRIFPRGSGPVENTEPVSVPSLLRKCAERSPDRVAMRVQREGIWQQWTYKDYLHDVRTAAKGFIALGLERYHSVCILGFNSPEWFISDLAAISAGGLAAGIYTTNSPDACAYCALDSKANIFVVEDASQLAKILKIRHQLPHLKAIVQYVGEPTEEGVLSWAKFMTLGSQQPDVDLEARLKDLSINQCCTLIYTSGTTGNPKGVMLSHDNLTWLSHVTEVWADLRETTDEHQDMFVSFLPLSHVAAQMTDIWGPLSVCGAVTFADKNALKGGLVDNLKEARPTKFIAVPRVWEKMHERITEVGRGTVGLKKVIATWAKGVGLEVNMKRMNGVQNPETFAFKIANKLVFSKIREALGLDRCDVTLSGAAPISPEILKFFMALNVVVTEAYGMSECSGPHTMAINSAFRLGSVGKTMGGSSTMILKPDKDGYGEILMGGRHVFMGYLNDEGKTMEAIDDEGWLHTGDVGRVDPQGFLFITGRLKEILITAGGENVAPVPIEDSIKIELPIVSQAVVIGDKHRFLSMLLTFKTEVNFDTQQPLEALTPACKEWIELNGNCTVSTLPDVLNELYKKDNKELIAAIQSGIDRSNAKAASRAQLIQKWVVLPTDFSIGGGELGPTLKLKRAVVCEMYKDLIFNFYKDIKK